MIFHRHKWEISSQRFNGPREVDFKNVIGVAAILVVEEAMHGVTITSFRCVKCGDIKSQRDIGDISANCT